MKISRKTSIGEFAALVASHLQSKGISTVLTGGAVVSIYTENKYMSYDADFISPADQKTINKAMQELGFEKHGKDFRHKQTDFFVEFPSGPLAIGNQLIQAEARARHSRRSQEVIKLFAQARFQTSLHAFEILTLLSAFLCPKSS